MKGDPSSSPGLIESMGSHPGVSRILLEGSPVGILLLDRERRIQDLNPRMEAWLGKPRAQVIGRICHEVLFLSEEPCTSPEGGCPSAQALATEEPSPKIVRGRVSPDGTRQEFEIRAYPIADESGQSLYTLEFVHDRTASALLRRYQEEAHLRDPLTGLYNRTAFHAFLAREMNRAKRQGHSFSLALADFDCFKDYNERQGDEAGDALLQRMADLLIACTRRDVDNVFRLEGDRFGVTLPETRSEQADQIRERIRLAEKERRFPVTFSLAVCQAREGEDASALLHRAEGTLFLAKKGGGTRIG